MKKGALEANQSEERAGQPEQGLTKKGESMSIACGEWEMRFGVTLLHHIAAE